MINLLNKYHSFFMSIFKNIYGVFRNFNLIIFLASLDIKVKYSRSKLGIFWLTLNLFITISLLAIVFSYLLSNKIDSYFPSLAVGMVIWFYIESSISESSTSLIDAKEMILETRFTYHFYFIRVLIKNFIILLHNLTLIPLLYIFFDINFNFNLFLLIPSLLLLFFFLLSIAPFLSIISLRYRDFPILLQNLLRLLFYITPIIWNDSFIRDQKILDILKLNPFYTFMEMTRGPLLGQSYNFNSFMLFLIITTVIFISSLFFLEKYKKKIAYLL